MNLNYQSYQIFNKTAESITEADSAISLLGRALLPKAAELARSGRYLEAECLLQHLVQEGSELPAVFDLLARIRAQQGRLLEAQSYWADAIQLSSAKDFYRTALKRIERLQTGPPWVGRIRPLFIGLSLLISFILVIFATLPFLGGLKASAGKIANRNTPNTAVITPVKRPPQIKISIPGVKVNTKDEQLVLIFESGLFLHQTELRPEAKVTLDFLANQLRPYKGKIQANIEGHTDDIPISNGWIYRDNVSLGLQRAVTVIDYLRLKGQLPAKMFKASSVGELHSLYPNDTLHNQLRNRTVVIRITTLK